jgi:carboxymethylenebutenolidase
VTVPGGDGLPPIPGYAVLPPGARRGVVVIHEIFGRQPEIDAVVDRFGALGYAGIAPDLCKAPSLLGCIRNTMLAMREGRGPAVAQANAIRRWLCERTGIAETNVGIIGFCLGGSFALAVGRGWGAISTNYGQIPSNPEVIRGLGPTIGCYGGRDRPARGAGATLESRLRPLGVEVETYTFPQAGHAFLTDGDHKVLKFLTAPLLHIDYDAATAEEAWSKIAAFFDKHLGDGSPRAEA